MQESLLSHYVAVLFGIALTAVSQILIKYGSRSSGDSFWRVFLNPYTITAYFMLLTVTILNLYAFMKIPLKAALIILPLNLLLVVFLSMRIFDEKLSRRQIVGVVLTVFGIMAFNI